MYKIKQIQKESPYKIANASIVLDVPQDDTEHAGKIVLLSPMGRRAIYGGQDSEILAHDVIHGSSPQEACPASYFFGPNVMPLIQTLWQRLPQGYSLRAMADQAVLAGPHGVWMVADSPMTATRNASNLNRNMNFRPEYSAVALPEGGMAVSGSRHARMEFLDSPTGRSLMAQWTLSDITLPHADQDRFTVMFRQRGQTVLCSAGSHLNILGAWRDFNS